MGPSKFEALIDGAFAIALTGWGATPPHKCTDGPVLAGGGPTEFDHVTPRSLRRRSVVVGGRSNLR